MKEILFKSEEAKYLEKLLNKEADSKVKKSLLTKLKNAQKKIKVSSAKGKGRNLQYWVCERLASMFNVDYVQSDDNCLIQSRPMGQHGTDIILRGKVYDAFPFDIECKACETLSIPDWVRQSKANTKKDRDWMLVFKKQTIGTEPLIILEWKTFEKYYRKLINGGYHDL